MKTTYVLTPEEEAKIQKDLEENGSLDAALGRPISMLDKKYLPDGPARDPDTAVHPQAARQLQVSRYEEYIQEYWARILELYPDIPEKTLTNPNKNGNS